MGCAGIAALNNDGKLPDTTETIIYAGGFALWIVFWCIFKRNWLPTGRVTHAKL